MVMTIRKRLETELVNHGLWPNEAEAVMTELEADEASKPMQGRWNEDETVYPPQLLAVVLMSAKTKAVEWIDRNKPMHFARGVLEA
jgi:ribonuclease I